MYKRRRILLEIYTPIAIRILYLRPRWIFIIDILWSFWVILVLDRSRIWSLGCFRFRDLTNLFLVRSRFRILVLRVRRLIRSRVRSRGCFRSRDLNDLRGLSRSRVLSRGCFRFRDLSKCLLLRSCTLAPIRSCISVDQSSRSISS